MQISLSGHHEHSHDRLLKHIKKKLAKLERHFDHISNTHVIIQKGKLGYEAEATLHASRTEIFANAEANDPFTAVDALAVKLDRQIVKHKEKISSHRGHSLT